MKIESLLDKKEENQIEILRLLLLETNKSFTGIQKEINISKNTLKSYISDLEQVAKDLDSELHIENTRGDLSLSLDSKMSFNQILSYYIEQSLGFQILNYVFMNHKFSSVQLSQHLCVSESSIFRKIKVLNTMLKEFDIGIKNGRLVGSELQIRYFYFQLYRFLMDNDPKAYLSSLSDALVSSIELQLSSKIEGSSRLDLYCWLQVSKDRYGSENTSRSSLVNKGKLFVKDRLYQDLEEIIESQLQDLQDKSLIFEIMSLYSFINSYGIMDKDGYYRYELSRSKRLPTAMLDVYVREQILRPYKSKKLNLEIEKQVGFYLAKLNNKIYFFKGSLNLFDHSNVLKKQRDLINQDLFALALNIRDKALKEIKQAIDDNNYLQKELFIGYVNILSIIDFHITETVRIGIDLDSLPFYTINYYQFLNTNLSSVKGAQVEKLDLREDYDLVISNNTRDQDKYRNFYVLSEFESNFDIKEIKKIIEQIKTEKNTV